MGCSKIPYPDKKTALKEAKMIRVQMKRFNKGADKLKNKKFSAYHCWNCGLWHLTTEKRR